MKHVHYLSLREGTPAKGYWDQHLLSKLLTDCEEVKNLEGIDECIVVIPGAYQFALVEEINEYISTLKRVKVIVTSDEENKFPLHELKHPNMELFAMYPHETTAKVTWLPIGAPPHIEKQLPYLPEKDIDIFFSGQVNHESRRKMIEAIDGMENSVILKTNGFAQGLDHDNYYHLMTKSKVVAAPRGNISPDSFRFYEAIENGCVPVAEEPKFWDKLFEWMPCPVIDKTEQWKGYIEDSVKSYPKMNINCMSWWKKQKQYIKSLLLEKDYSYETTIVIPVSYIPSHPSTHVLEETIKSIRHHMPNELILITFDGLRNEHGKYEREYLEHIMRILIITKDDLNITTLCFNEHMHQSGMMKEIANFITTKFILYVEHDTPLVTDYKIDWKMCKKAIKSGDANLIRFHFEAFIPKEHEHLMIGKPENGLLKTVQWSQRPHLASTAYYRRIINDYFTKDARCFIEDKMHSVVQQAYADDRLQGWYQHRLHIYHPEGVIKRSYNLDGRAGGPKYDDTQIW